MEEFVKSALKLTSMEESDIDENDDDKDDGTFYCF